MPTPNEIRDLVEQDRFELMMRCPFYGRIICSVKLVVVSDPHVRMACTDYSRIFISADTYPSLPEEKRLAVLAHEVLHIALRHAFRIGDRDKNRFEKAADIEVTFVLTESFPNPYGIKVKEKWRELTAEQISYTYASEADLINVALFGQTAKQWRDANPGAKGNMRDQASLNQLLVLANMESYNAVLIEQGKGQSERLVLLHELAVQQLQTLSRLSINHLPRLPQGGQA